MTAKKLTPRQQEIAEKLAKQIAEYVDTVKAAEAKRAEAEGLDGADGYAAGEEYRYQMSRAREMLDLIEYDAAQEYATMPYKATRDAAINAFVAYVESIPAAQIAEAAKAAAFAAGTK